MDGARIVAQRYRLDEAVGVGGMGEVWRATDLELRRVVALKKSQAGDSAQIRREARIGAGLHHPHVVTVFDAVTDGADRWLVMEYLPSRNLSDLVRTAGPLSAGAAARVVAQIADAVAAMHAKGMVHRDIKPGNVLVAPDGTAKLTDLGIARWAEVTRTHETNAGGTPGYLAPEVVDGVDADTRADVFALGATLFAATTGRSPWGGPEQGPFVQLHRARAYQLEPLPDNELAPALRALLARDPAARPTATQAHHGLAALAGGSVRPIAPLGAGEPSAPPEATPTVVPPPPRRGPVIALGVLLVLLLVAGAVLWSRSPGHEAGQAVPAPGTDNPIGDPHTFDPCSVLDPGSLAKYGTVGIERDYGNFAECALLVHAESGEQTETRVVFSELIDELTPVPQRGQITPYHAQMKDETCVAYVVLKDLTELTITTKYLQKGDDSICAMSERAATSAVTTLGNGPLKRLNPPYAPNSMALVDACSLLTAQELEPVLETTAAPQAGFGEWSCEWGEDDAKQVDLDFGREWQLDNTEDDIGSEDEPVQLADRTGYEDTEDPDTCVITIPNRRYTATGTPFDEFDIRDETIVVHLTVPGTTDAKTVCPATIGLANAVIPRLPPR